MKAPSQMKPMHEAKLFYPQHIKSLAHSSPTFTKDGLEMYWSTVPDQDNPRSIYCSKFHNGEWLSPEMAPFSGAYNDDQPFIAHDGQTLYFASHRPSPSSDEKKLRMWQMKKTDSGWDDAKEVGEPIGFWTPSITNDGTLYYLDTMAKSHRSDSENRAGIYRSELINGKYETSELLPEHINLEGSLNWCPYISPDESFILFSSDRPGSSGSGDLYVSFRLKEGEWTEVVNLGKSINTDHQERFPGLSPDGKYLFFTRSTDIENHHDLYWISTTIIYQIKNDLNIVSQY